MWITAVPVPWRCLQSRLLMRAMVLHSHWEDHPICDPSRIIATRCSYCPVNLLRPKNCIYLQSHLSCLYKLNCNLFSHHDRLFSASATNNNPSFFLLSSGDCAMDRGTCTMTCIPRAPWKYSLQFIFIFRCNISISFKELGPVAVFQYKLLIYGRQHDMLWWYIVT